MKIGITGGYGFIGSHLATDLRGKKDVKLSFFGSPDNNLLEPRPAVLRKFVEDNDVIVHAAGVNRGSEGDIIIGSVVATYNLISALVKFKSKAKLIFLSSIQAERETIYGISKRLTEVMLKSFSEQYKIPVSIFRLSNVFGEGCRPFYNSVVATFCHQAAVGQKLSVYPGSRHRKLNLIYVGDVCRSLKKEIFVRRKTLFHFRRISSKNEITVGDLAKIIISFKKVRSLKELKSKFHRDLYRTYLFYLNSNGR